MSEASESNMGSVGGEKSTGPSFSFGDDMNASASIGIGEESSSGVSIPESVVSPLIGAGANVYILTNELTQSMREKLGTSWPFVQDTLNSRNAKLLAGGFLASVAAIVLWKILRRLVSKPKPPPEPEEETWTTTKTYEVTPVAELKHQMMRPDAETAGLPVHMLPHKIQLRIAETPMSASKGMEPDIICKARDPVTRNRHTRRMEQRQGEQLGDAHSPWHTEQHRGLQQDLECTCPSELCASLPLPRLLYSVRESHMEQRAMNLSNQRVVNFLSCSSCPSALCPAALESWTPHGLTSKPFSDPSHGVHALAGYPPLMNPIPTGFQEGVPLCVSYQQSLHPSYTGHGLMSPAGQSPINMMTSMYEPVHHGSQYPGFMQNGVSCISVLPTDAVRTTLAWPRGASMSSVQGSRTGASLSGMVPDPESRAHSQERENRRRSVCQQTDGQPVDEDLDMPGRGRDTQHRSGHMQTSQSQHVPTRTAQSPVTPSQCTNTPLRSDNAQMHFHTSTSYPTHLSNISQSHHPAGYQTSQGMVFHASQSGVLSSSCQGTHQHPAALNGSSNRTLTGSGHYAPGEQMLSSSMQQTQQMQQQQQPVVQHPSDSSVSQNSSEACSSQDRQCESVNSGAITSHDIVPQDGMLLPQQHFVTRGANISPRAITDGQCVPSRALTEYAHNDYPWRGPYGLHSYQPTPIYVFGYHPPDSKNYSLRQSHPWSPQGSMFFSPFVSAPAGVFAPASPGVLPSSQGNPFPSPPGHMMPSHLQNPYMYPPIPVPDMASMAFNTNFNLSNSNTHGFVQGIGRSSAPAASLYPESNTVRVVELDHSIVSDSADAATVTSETASACASMTSTQDKSRNGPGKEEIEISVCESDQMNQYMQQRELFQMELAAREQSDAFQAGAESQSTDAVLTVGAAASEDSGIVPCPADLPVKENSRESLQPPPSKEGSARNGLETQL